MKSTESSDVKADRRQAALDYHEFPTHGKISVAPTKQLVTESDLALAAEILEAVLEEHPDRTEAHALLADAYGRNGMPERVLACREQVEGLRIFSARRRGVTNRDRPEHQRY